jgi:uroporphyrinogen decarboxylase
MTNRENALAILRYQRFERLPVVHFGYWEETLEKWCNQGHITKYEYEGWADGNEFDDSIAKKLGFDFNWFNVFSQMAGLIPAFERTVVEELGGGKRKILNKYGVVELESDGAGSIPAEIDYTLVDRKSWEEQYKPRLKYTESRVDSKKLSSLPLVDEREVPIGLYCGSLFGVIRNWMGVTGVSYLYADDEELYDEIINIVGDLCYKTTSLTLESGTIFDFAHFWEDICFKNGPLVSPKVFNEKVGPQYKKITTLLNEYGIDIISLDCDGLIDSLIPTWIENGVNTMFPIEVGTWDASIAPWREKYGKELRGVGGMRKYVFALDYPDIDVEVERLKPLIDLGGFIPCPDHRIAPDAKWENVQYYCEKMRNLFLN